MIIASTSKEDRFDPKKAIAHLGAPWPQALVAYRQMPGYAETTDENGLHWYRQLHKAGPDEDPVFIIRDVTESHGVPISFLDGPMDVHEAYDKAPYLFPPCFKPAETEDTACSIHGTDWYWRCPECNPHVDPEDLDPEEEEV